MSLFPDEKRKNDVPRRFQWWLLVVGFALGVIVTLILVPSRNTVTVSPVEQSEVDGINLTATQIIAGATGTAAAPQAASGVTDDEAIYATATYIVQQATQTAEAVTAQAGS